MDSRRLEINTLVGMAASIALCLAKFLAGWLGHSSALIADGVESLADTVGSVVVWRGLRLASKPPDETHPYGYGKAEALAALGVGALLLGAAAFIVIESFNKLLSPHPPPEPWTLAIIAAVIVVKETLFRVTIDGARKTDSDAARADAWHHRADSITSAAAFIGVSIAVAGPRWFAAPRLVFADEVAAMVASGVIVITGFSLGLPALRELLDAASPELANTVRATAASVPGVRLVEKVETRKSGRGYLLDMHLHVDPAMSVHDAHALAGLVKATVRKAHANVGRVLIHVEPGEAFEPASPNQRQPRSAEGGNTGSPSEASVSEHPAP